MRVIYPSIHDSQNHEQSLGSFMEEGGKRKMALVPPYKAAGRVSELHGGIFHSQKWTLAWTTEEADLDLRMKCFRTCKSSAKEKKIVVHDVQSCWVRSEQWKNSVFQMYWDWIFVYIEIRAKSGQADSLIENTHNSFPPFWEHLSIFLALSGFGHVQNNEGDQD